jgi:predicted DNA binding CopG/RHH family protein
MNRGNKRPKFNSVREEQEYWRDTDSAEMTDWSRAQAVTFSNLKPTVRSISIRLTQSMIDELKLLANKKDVPYQSLMKMYLSEKIRDELHSLK